MDNMDYQRNDLVVSADLLQILPKVGRLTGKRLFYNSDDDEKDTTFPVLPMYRMHKYYTNSLPNPEKQKSPKEQHSVHRDNHATYVTYDAYFPLYEENPLKNLWARRVRNAWLLAELILVTVLTWYITDPLFVLSYNQTLPLGYEPDGLLIAPIRSLPSTAFL